MAPCFVAITNRDMREGFMLCNSNLDFLYTQEEELLLHFKVKHIIWN